MGGQEVEAPNHLPPTALQIPRKDIQPLLPKKRILKGLLEYLFILIKVNGSENGTEFFLLCIYFLIILSVTV